MTQVLDAPRPLVRARSGLRALLGARELVTNLVARDLKVRHRGTVLGLLWSLITPLLLVGLYTLIFSVIFRFSPAPHTHYPFAIYLFGGLVVWNFFSNSVGGAVGSVVGAGYLLRKVYFPRAILPLANVLSSLVTFGFEFAVLMAAVLAFRIWPSPFFALVPLIVLITAVFAYGLGLLLSALTVFFRDIAHFITIVLQLWFWGTPIIYSLAIVHRPIYRRILLMNPMSELVVGFKHSVLDGLPTSPMWLLYSSGVAVATLLLGAFVFIRLQRLFPELV